MERNTVLVIMVALGAVIAAGEGLDQRFVAWFKAQLGEALPRAGANVPSLPAYNPGQQAPTTLAPSKSLLPWYATPGFLKNLGINPGGN